MRTSALIASLFLGFALISCSGDPSFVGGPGAPGNPSAAEISVVTSAPTLPSAAGQTVTITATVLDAGGLPLQGAAVLLSSDSGTLGAGGPLTTDANGNVSTTLGAGSDAANRTITVTASIGALQDTVTVDVVGTTLSIAGPAGLPNGGTGNYTATLLDSSMNGIQSESVDLTSDNGNTLSASSLMTDAAGEIQFQVTGAVTGMDTLTAASLGLVATQVLNVTDDTFVLTAPAAGAQIQLNVDEPVELTWMISGVPQVGQTIGFATTFGTLSGPTADTDANGVASVTISSAAAGSALISATNGAGTTAQVQVEFVAPVTVGGPGVTKPSGTLASPPQGPAVNPAGVTVSLATTNTVVRPDAASYSIEFIARVTDSQGAGIAGVAIDSEILTNGYLQGAWNWYAAAGSWVQSVTAGPCAVDGQSEAVATLASAGVLTDQSGRARITLRYPADYGRWMDVTLLASATVDGADIGVTSDFQLPIASEDIRSVDKAPPGVFSPYGTGKTCGSML